MLCMLLTFSYETFNQVFNFSFAPPGCYISAFSMMIVGPYAECGFLREEVSATCMGGGEVYIPPSFFTAF